MVFFSLEEAKIACYSWHCNRFRSQSFAACVVGDYSNGWYCQVLQEDLKTSLPLKLRLASSDKLVVLVDQGQLSH